MARCASKEPAWARVAPRAEKKMLGVGEMVLNRLGQVLLSVTMWGRRFGYALEIARRATA